MYGYENPGKFLHIRHSWEEAVEVFLTPFADPAGSFTRTFLVPFLVHFALLLVSASQAFWVNNLILTKQMEAFL